MMKRLHVSNPTAWTRWTAIACTMLLVAGCGGHKRGPKVPRAAPVPVKGVVTYQGKPLAEAKVLFIPQAGESGVGGIGQTDEQGMYDGQTISEDGFMSPGISPGKYRVSFSKLIKPDGTPVPANSTEPPANLAAREMLPPSISDPLASGQLVQIPESGGTFDFKLK